MLNGGELFPLTKGTWKIYNKDSFNGLVNLETVSLAETNRQVLAVTWESPHPKVIPLNVRDAGTLNKFDQAEFVLTLQTEKELPLKRIVIRFKDSAGEIFQLAPTVTGTLKPGKNELHYVFDTTDPVKSTDSIWSGNGNKQVDWPLHVSGISLDLNAQTPDHGRILLDALEVRYKDERCTTSLNTGHPLHLLLPDQKSQPELVVKNLGDIPLKLAGSLKITDFQDKIYTSEVSVTVPANAETPINLPGDYTPNGWWKVDYLLKSASGKEYLGTHRFGRMTPAGPTPGRAEGEYLFGMCVHPQSPFLTAPETGELEALAAGMCGIKIARTDLHWWHIQPQRDKMDFSLFDRIIDAYGRNGIEIQGILAYSVKWATNPNCSLKNPYPYANEYAKYAQAVVHRYKDRIKYYEIWNEPNLDTDVEMYMELLRSAYEAIKAEAPEVVVMSGGLPGIRSRITGKPEFESGLLKLLQDDQGKHFDIFAYHCHSSFAGYVNQLKLLKDHNLIGSNAPRSWYSTETGMTSVLIGEQKQAFAMFTKMLYSWSEGAIAHNWYVLREKPKYPVGHPERHFGIITVDFEPKPGYLTFNMLTSLYGGGRFLRRLDFTPGIYACLFENQAQDGLLGLWGNGVSKILWITGLPEGTTKIDLFGNETPFPVHNGLGILQISDKPYSLRIPNIAQQNIQCAGEVFSGNFPKQLSVSAGGNLELSITVNNPLKHELDLNVQVQTTGKVSAKLPSNKLSIPAGGSKAVQIKLTADREFKATPVSPEKLTISIAPAGATAETISIPVISRTSGDEPMFQMDKPEQYYSLIPSIPGNEPWYWKGAEDLSAKVYMKRQGAQLYIKVEVRDDVHVQPFRGSEVYKGDNVQFALQLPDQTGYWKFGLTQLADGKSEIYCWERPIGYADSLDGITLKTTRDETKKTTTYWAKIPLLKIGMTPDVAASGFRFNLIVNDNDDDRREGFIYITPGMGAGEEPLLWPVINL